MRRLLATTVVLTATAALAVSCAGWNRGGGAKKLAGTWEGTGVQVPTDGADNSWPLRVVLNPQGDGAIAYPTLNCGGPLTRLRSLGNTAVYREVITYGLDNCIEGGTVTIVSEDGKLFWYWTGEGTAEPEVSAAAVLKKVGP